MTRTAVILAAGLGTRMKSALPKTLHRIAGRPMLRHLLASCEQVFDRIVVVVGPGHGRGAAGSRAARLRGAAGAPRHRPRRAAGRARMFGDGEVAVLYADNPLIRPETLRRLLDRRGRRRRGAGAARVPPGRSRPLRPRDHAATAMSSGSSNGPTPTRRSAPRRCAMPACCAPPPADMARWLDAVRADNAKGEYYLTDVVALARADGAPRRRGGGAGRRTGGHQLARRTRAPPRRWCSRWLRDAAMEAGVTMIDPAIGVPVRRHRTGAGRDDRAERGLRPGRDGGGRREIRAFSHLEGCIVGPGCIIGPFARLRPGAVLARRRMSATSSR